MTTINVIAAFVLMVWACWCGFSRSVNDGIVGKCIYAFIAVASLAIVVGEAELQTYRILVVCFAALGVRHYYLRYLKKRVFKRATS
ncbi:hypothetical protein WT15_23825 [Burkholderia stagnalis]|uniref:hypothetical protein n=1 Tax=Burkholderia cepacia complex TaxID=87882 RepID=UPI0007529759|nr:MULTISPECIES: hypothetical protein [Burkholderia cepacia complex]KVM76498.1 hypothetical protein WJ61_09895 [Burkholderia ubonensis]KVN73873.1 hypothetical protein WT15_23825 [Burkholderia stagnalis]KWO27047.1 hypothetical protein WT96_31220 [Burkholderia stagnalis]KWO45044.1 hypothetical protein WT95_26860 [Burkholderia stagnalis]OJA60410.1 hypothetical protein BGV69_05745 [Burkholderia ubonensis]